jgi:hypothetical protein
MRHQFPALSAIFFNDYENLRPVRAHVHSDICTTNTDLVYEPWNLNGPVGFFSDKDSYCVQHYEAHFD